VFSWFESPPRKLLKTIGRNTTQPRLENTISKQVSACTLKSVIKAKSSNIGLAQQCFQRISHSVDKVASFLACSDIIL
jgi:hypothetical protein